MQTQPNAESKAVAHLARQGFATYLPRYLKRRRHARRVDVVAAPLFPRYLFVEIDMAVQRWRSIYSTIGVSQLVCNGDVPAPVPDQVITMLKDREDAAGFIHLDREPQFRVVTRSASWKAYLAIASDSMMACRTATASRFFSICSGAKFACC